MTKQGKCLSCKTHMPWGTPVCPGCGVTLRWNRKTGIVEKSVYTITALFWGIPALLIGWFVVGFMLSLVIGIAAGMILSTVLVALVVIKAGYEIRNIRRT